jgi:GTP cyclohydrolase I
MSEPKTYLKWEDLKAPLRDLVKRIRATSKGPHLIYGVPRGGVPVATLLLSYMPGAALADRAEEATVFVDDIVDSGATKAKFAGLYPGKPFLGLFDKPAGKCPPGWLVFPWEQDERQADDSIVGTITNRFREQGVSFKANDNIGEHLQLGELDEIQKEVEKRAQKLLEGLVIDTGNCHNSKGTAKRMAKMYCREIFSGRYSSAPDITDFPNAGNLDEAYTTGPITVRSTCSHHMCPIVGHAWIGIIPGEKVIGLSKFNRLLDWVASRPQIQEELVIQVANAIEERTKPKGLAVVIKATHTCMTCRGVKESSNAVMTTSVMRGAFRDKPEARAEFFALIK